MSRVFFTGCILRSIRPQKKLLRQATHVGFFGACDIHPFSLSMPDTKSFFLHNCDKNTNYYWGLTLPSNLPRCEELLIDGHPCSAELVSFLLDRLEKDSKFKLSISSHFLTNWYRYRGGEDLMKGIEFGRVQIHDSEWFDNIAKEYSPLNLSDLEKAK